MPSKVVAGVIALIGLGILIGTAVPMSQELKKPAKDQSSSRKIGLGFGIAIGAIMLVVGIYMLFKSVTTSNSGSTNSGNKNGKQQLLQSGNPFNEAAAGAAQTEMNAVMMAKKANNKAEQAGELREAIGKFKAFI